MPIRPLVRALARGLASAWPAANRQFVPGIPRQSPILRHSRVSQQIGVSATRSGEGAAPVAQLAPEQFRGERARIGPSGLRRRRNGYRPLSRPVRRSDRRNRRSTPLRPRSRSITSAAIVIAIPDARDAFVRSSSVSRTASTPSAQSAARLIVDVVVVDVSGAVDRPPQARRDDHHRRPSTDKVGVFQALEQRRLSRSALPRARMPVKASTERPRR